MHKYLYNNPDNTLFYVTSYAGPGFRGALRPDYGLCWRRPRLRGACRRPSVHPRDKKTRQERRRQY